MLCDFKIKKVKDTWRKFIPYRKILKLLENSESVISGHTSISTEPIVKSMLLLKVIGGF